MNKNKVLKNLRESREDLLYVANNALKRSKICDKKYRLMYQEKYHRNMNKASGVEYAINRYLDL